MIKNMDFRKWLFKKLPLPKGVKILAESSYHNDVDGVLYSRRNLKLDLKACSSISDDKLIPREVLLRQFMQDYFQDAIEDFIGVSLKSDMLSGGDEGDVLVLYNELFQGLIQLRPIEENYWRAYFAFTQNSKMSGV